MKIIITGRTRSGKTTLARYLAERMGTTILKTCTNRPKRYPEEDTYHFYNADEAAAIPKENKKLLTTGLDGYERWTTMEDLSNAGIAILDEAGIYKATTLFHGLGHRVLFLYAMASEDDRRNAEELDAEKNGTDINDAMDAFYSRTLTENDQFDRIETWIRHVPNHNYIKEHDILQPDYCFVWRNTYNESDLADMYDEIQDILKKHPIMNVIGGRMQFSGNTDFVLDPEDWSEKEWQTICKLYGLLPGLTEVICVNPPAIRTYVTPPEELIAKKTQKSRHKFTDVIVIPDATAQLIDDMEQVLKKHGILYPQKELSGPVYKELSDIVEAAIAFLLDEKTDYTEIIKG